MNLQTGQRTFCLGLSGLGLANGATQTVDVPFVDSAGNGMNCNYFKLHVSEGNITGNKNFAGVIAEVSGVAHEGDAVTDALSALTASPNTSGICGVGVSLGGLGSAQSTEWHGSNGQVATGIKLIITADEDDFVVMITYGNLYPLNPLRLEQSYDAGS
jgi:hypothetical protein